MTSEKNGLDQLLLALVPELRAFARSLCKDPALADDLVQDTLVKAWEHREALRDRSRLKPWLLTILRNEFFAHLRQRRAEVEDIDGMHATQQIAFETQNHEVAISEVRRALERLPLEEREALVLVAVEQLSYQKAAEVCDCPVGTLKSRVNRARSRLKQLLESGPRLAAVALKPQRHSNCQKQASRSAN